MKSYRLLFLDFLAIFLVGCAKDEAPTLKIGYVGHDHQTALYIACLEGEKFEKDYNLYLKPVKEKEFYELIDRGKKIANVEL
jgi:NitT/TauT family transport system substrate-binding protein